MRTFHTRWPAATTWVPHITLAHDDLTPALAGPVVASLAGRDFSWELPVNNLALIYDDGSRQTLRARFDFQA